jgi:hypothetical protein
MSSKKKYDHLIEFDNVYSHIKKKTTKEDNDIKLK